ncbi:serine-rich adhesin for platelets [Teleopsis dalmanni]|uniref:serine-rich adhesin for platelets n=1 Tax=Teleopsis dalmanni TaxID=139649 RepID=UPI0018CFEE56|nr:serine-rich adhesin for platelets [Teleopsis dalmanni]
MSLTKRDTNLVNDIILDEEADVEVEIEVIEDVDVDVDAVRTQKPHFLDYDAVPPSDFEENFNRALSFDYHSQSKNKNGLTATISTTGEHLKLDKRYERDGEVSDYELAACGYTKKEFTQDDNTLHLIGCGGDIIGSNSQIRSITPKKGAFNKPKHFLDENPIPPDYMLEHEMREHRSLDRNFERQNEQRTGSPSSLLSGRKSSLDCSKSSSRSSRERFKEPSYTLSRFLDNDALGAGSPTSLPPFRFPKSAAWTDSFDSHYGSLQLNLSHHSGTSGEIDHFGPKVECVYSLLSMLGSNDPLEMSKKFLELSRTVETCATLRRSGCIPLLVQMMHSEGEENVRKCAGMALHNVVHSHPDEKAGRREAKVLRLLDQIMDYCNFLKTLLQSGGEAIADDSDRHPLAAISSLMKVSFDEEHRHAMCELGALHAIPSLVHLDHAVHGPRPEDQCCNSLRRYALMALTNLTFGDENNKALLCSQKLFMEALVAQLDSAPDDLLQVTASVLRNLSWRADSNMKAVLNEIGTVTALAHAAMKNKCENTLKAILSALWNLSAHCSTNKAEFCAVDGALAFLVNMLTYEGPSKTLKIIENAGGILRNVSSHIAVNEHYRQILRDHNCLMILLQQLKSESLTVVSNSCGTLWNLSARCPEDQKFLWDNGAVPMLRSLIHSKHTMISEGSSSALKNLLNFRPNIQNQNHLDPIARSMGLKKLPSLNVRKQKALELELGAKDHAETCDNLDVGPSTLKESQNFNGIIHTQRRYPVLGNSAVIASNGTIRLTRSAMLTKSESRDSIFSAKSDSAYENVMRSHSASDTNRKTQKSISYAIGVPVPRAAFALSNDSETIEDKPIDYSVKYNENLPKNIEKNLNSSKVNDQRNEDNVVPGSNFATYQETDLDQPTDFSLRYAENHIESDVDITSTEVHPGNTLVLQNENKNVEQINKGNEILLILEDSVKCYQTEDTPYVISNAASVTDLRQNKLDTVQETSKPSSSVVSTKKYSQSTPLQQTGGTVYGSGTYTPEKPTNYCEEGTPGYFSRYDSLSSLDGSPPVQQAQLSNEGNEEKSKTLLINNAATKNITSQVEQNIETSTSPEGQTSNTNINSAQETPLMFSRHSSMDSLVEEDIGPCDDKSSVVSDFSRLASGVISPSEIPDSPTQSMPQSPRRNSNAGQTAYSTGLSPLAPRTPGANSIRAHSDTKRPLRSVFEDNINLFHVENTPAQFSCATSLSNLSIIDDENATTLDLTQQHSLAKISSSDATISTVENTSLLTNIISEGEEEDAGTNNDDLLLANCINIGMNRTTAATVSNIRDHVKQVQSIADEPKQYFTEDTPALLSKVGSNSNLSALSICSSNNEIKEEFITDQTINKTNRHSLNLSDDISSNASETGTTSQTLHLLQQCIRDGMIKPNQNGTQSENVSKIDPIAMMKSGGHKLPTYLPVTDEMNKYLVEDSPCNFSMMSELSNLTVGSSLVGPAVQLKECASSKNVTNSVSSGILNVDHLSKPTTKQSLEKQEDVRREQQWQDDSLSSLSIDSEDDTNLLSQAIAAGCNRPKSNLGFSSTSTSTSKRSTSLSSSQPIPINLTTSASSLNSKSTSNKYQRQLQSKQNGNESYSSVDSSDSNDNQSKSLLELCILTGMNKSRESNNRKHSLHNNRLKNNNAVSTQSNPNLKQADSPVPMISSSHQKPHTPNRHIRERERKDEKLLMECINTGISKKIGNTTVQIENKHKTKEFFFAANAVPKNVQATSAAALGPCHQMAAITSLSANSTAAPDVEANIETNLTSEKLKEIEIESNSNSNPDGTTKEIKNIQSIAAEECLQCHETDQKIAKAIGSKENMCDEVYNSISMENITSDESNLSFIIETTVSFEKAPHAEVITSNKHKDPDLMLKSVERLTLEFVSSAEQLRTNSSSDSHSNENNKRLGSISVGTFSNSNNTWNEDTCPNDVSFPSVSITAPIVASLNYDNENEYDDDDDDEQTTHGYHKELNDFAEITPTNEEQPQPSLGLIYDETDMYGNTQPNSLGTDTETLVYVKTTDSITANVDNSVDTNSGTNSSGINFKVGGEVQSAAVTHGQKMFLSNSSMTNSTIIAIEALALAENLQFVNDCTEQTFNVNSLDLDNIRPPSGMDSLNISGYYQELSPGNTSIHNTHLNPVQRTSMSQSPQILTKSPKFPRKPLPVGLVARRALGQLPGHLASSTESVNSSCNLLDNIKPPSLMDELLDSMISVASIQSEVADCDSMATTMSGSNYETANCGNEFDDNTVTLQTCADILPHDDDDDEISVNSSDTQLPTDYSSVESTPKKSQSSPNGVKRTLTPKQKRKLNKDRFKTYTIAADIVLNGEQQRGNDFVELDETLQIEIIDNTPPKTKFNKRRSNDQDRYKTQTIIYPVLSNTIEQSNSISSGDCLSEDISSIVAMTKQFKFISEPLNRITNASAEPNAAQTQTAITNLSDNDYNSMEHDQNSETESCHGRSNNCTDNEEDPIEIAVDKCTDKPRILKPNDFKSNEIGKEQEAETKTVRGRKKPAYVSPYSMQYQRNNTAAAKKSLNTPALTSKHSAPKKGNEIATSGTNSSQKNVNNCSVPATIERQGTFVKDEPSVLNKTVPIVEMSSTTSSSPTQRMSKLPTKQTKTNLPNMTGINGATRKAAATSTIRSSNKSLNTGARKIQTTTTTKSMAGPQRSNTNAVIRVASTTARIAVLSTRGSNTTPPSRSNSTLNGNSPPATKISQTQSRIASIWKRVDEAKSKQQPQTSQSPQKTKYTTSKANVSNLRTLNTKSSSTLSTQKQKLIRSSTFDNISPLNEAAGVKKTVASTAIVTPTISTKIAVNKSINNSVGLSGMRKEQIAVRK